MATTSATVSGRAGDHALVERLRMERGLLELLTAVTVGVNESASAEHAFRVALNAVCSHTAWPVGHAVDLDGERLTSTGVWVAAEPDRTAGLQRALAERLVDDGCAAAEAATSGRPAWMDARTGDGHAPHWRDVGIGGVGAWPVLAEGTVVALLEFGAREPEPPPEALANVLTSVCSQLAQALARMWTLERLRASEQQLSEAQQVASLASWTWDVTTGEVTWTDELFRLLGRAPNSVAPAFEWFIAHVHEHDRDGVYEQLEHTLASGERLDHEFRLVGADRQRTVHIGGEVARGTDGRTRLVGYLQDITPQSEAKAALARSEARVRLILQTSSDAFVAYDQALTVVEWNRAAEQLFGLARDKALGRPLGDLLVPAGHAGTHLLEVLTADDSPALDTAVEAVVRGRAGAPVPVEITIPRTPDDERRSAFIRDISERKRVEAALQKANATLRASVAALERRNRQVAVLNEMIDLLQSASEAAEGHRVVARFAEQLFPQCAGALYVAGPEGGIGAVAHWGGDAPAEPSLERDDCWALRRGRIHHAEPGATALLCPHARGERGATVCMPLLIGDETVGLLHLTGDPLGGEAEAGERDLLLTDFAERTALALANMRLRDVLRVQSIRDPLTGLYNRRYLEETFERELVRAHRNGYPLGVAMLDLDHFKQFNDRHGHQVGDAALRAFAHLLQEHVRADDVACRYGGEEFVVLFPNAPLEQVHERCELLRRRAPTLAMPAQGIPWDATVSVGIAAFPDHGNDAAAILRAADAALYDAKRAGRDRVAIGHPAG
jgi:diguanylate cyclase (GGDEF)-like protein/PAS domain S-box-containing protein